MINHDVPHHLRGRRYKVGPALPDRLGVIDQPQVGFIENRGRLQRVAGPLPAHVMVSEPVQLRMHQRKQLLQRSVVSVAPLAEQFGHRLSRGWRRGHEGLSPRRIVSRASDFPSTTGGEWKKAAQSWRVLRVRSAYAHEPEKQTGRKIQNRNQTLK